MNIAICLNEISFIIAKGYANKYDKSLLILYDSKRIRIARHDETKFQLRQLNSRFDAVAFFLFSLYLYFCGSLDVLLIPHHMKDAVILNKIPLLSKKVHYIDDGLDTVSKHPKNFNLSAYSKESIYYTFYEYDTSRLGLWLQSRKVEKIESIAKFVQIDHKYSFACGINSVLIIESPGMVTQAIEISYANLKKYVFIHPNPCKRLKWSSNVNKISNIYSVEKTILSMKNGTIVIGMTMSFVVYMYLATHNSVSVHVYLTKMMDESLNFSSSRTNISKFVN